MKGLTWDYYLTLAYLSFLGVAICFYLYVIFICTRELWQTRRHV